MQAEVRILGELDAEKAPPKRPPWTCLGKPISYPVSALHSITSNLYSTTTNALNDDRSSHLRSSVLIEAAAVAMLSRRLLTAAARSARQPIRPLSHIPRASFSTARPLREVKDGPLSEEEDPDMVGHNITAVGSVLTRAEWRLHQPSSDQAIKQGSIRRLG